MSITELNEIISKLHIRKPNHSVQLVIAGKDFIGTRLVSVPKLDYPEEQFHQAGDIFHLALLARLGELTIASGVCGAKVVTSPYLVLTSFCGKTYGVRHAFVNLRCQPVASGEYQTCGFGGFLEARIAGYTQQYEP